MSFYLKPGAFVVLEGLDATGKSTCLEAIQSMPWYWGERKEFSHPYFTHQPSGSNNLGEEIYALTEGRSMEPLTRQLLHLASHSEHYAWSLIPILDSGCPVVMDRCWWSTVAYGYFQGALMERGWDLDQFIHLAQSPAQGHLPDLVCLFTEPFVEDPHNDEVLEFAYGELAERYADTVALIPQAETKVQVWCIMSALLARGLAEER